MNNILFLIDFLILCAAVGLNDIFRRKVPDEAVILGIILRIIYDWETFPASAAKSLFLAGALMAAGLAAGRMIRRKALGGGDVKYIFMLSLYSGFAANAEALFFSCVYALLMYIFMADKQKTLPFAAALSLGWWTEFIISGI